jgi:DNA-binding PadR family transcriptional regulator
VGGARRILGLSGSNLGGRFFGPGELRLALLALVAEQPDHGYALMTRLENRFDGAYRASAGAVYPTLQQLQDERMLRARTVDGRKVYETTAAGRSELAAHAGDVAQVWARAASRGEWGVLQQPDAAEILAPALRVVKAAVKAVVHARGDPAVVDRVRQILDQARQQIDLLDRRRRR